MFELESTKKGIVYSFLWMSEEDLTIGRDKKKKKEEGKIKQ